MTARERVAGNVANYVDERTGAAAWLKKNLCWVRLPFTPLSFYYSLAPS
ncbi:MAG: hypothetical protein RL649_437 [Actinomycetota bacterium]